MSKVETKLSKIDEIRIAAEANLESFIRLISPDEAFPLCHQELCRWWTRPNAKRFQLVLYPRDHAKSRFAAFRVVWALTKDPTKRILYLSGTVSLAKEQIRFIKDILTSPIYRKYWGDMVNLEESKRAKWTETEIIIDHPKRKAKNIKEASIFAAGMTTTVTGKHFDIIVGDDVVVSENAFTEEGRNNVRKQFSMLASIGSRKYELWVVGTRYHPLDLYDNLIKSKVPLLDESGKRTGYGPLYEVLKREVEDAGDGTGEYLFPTMKTPSGEEVGFDQEILSAKKASYLDRGQFYAQYYHKTENPEDMKLTRDKFQYYNRAKLKRREGRWFINDTPLNVFASIDFAFSLSKSADYTAVVVIGIDPKRNIYVLDIERFKTDRILQYYNIIKEMHIKWDFRKLRAEVSVAQSIIVNDLKRHIGEDGLCLSIDEFRPSKVQGTKEERMRATLEPRYDNQQMWHYEGEGCTVLEDELLQQNPAHDDVKDALASAIGIATPPMQARSFDNTTQTSHNIITLNSRFGGRA